jgi:hypothetical protein
MKSLTTEDVRRALEQAAEDEAVEARVDLEMVRLPARKRRGEPAKAPAEQTFSAGDEEAQMWRNFASDLGLPDEPEEPQATITQAEILEMKRLSDMLPELLRDRSRPDDWSAEEERQYRQWARGMGLE